MNARKNTLLEGDIAAHLRRLSAPLAIGMLSMTVYSVIDVYFIARLGTHALAALGFTLPVTAFFSGIAYGLSVGTASLLSRTFGEGDFAKVRQLSTDTLVMAGMVFVLAAMLGLVTIDLIFPLMGAGESVMPLIRGYMTLWYLGLPFLGMLIVSNACMRALGDTRYVAFTMTAAAVACSVLSPLLIFGWGSFPALGMPGAALAFVLGHGVMFAYSFIYLAVKKQALSNILFHADSWHAWRRILHVALPSMVSNQVVPISAAIITWMAAGYGKEAVAALGVAGRIEGASVLAFYAVAAGVSIFSGQNYGAGNYGRIAQACVIGMRATMMIGLALAAIIWIFAQDIAGMFDDNALVITYATQYLHWVPVSFGALGALIVVNGALNAMGRPLWATGLICLRMFALYVPLAWVLQYFYGFFGIVLALLLSNLLSGVVAVIARRRLIC